MSGRLLLVALLFVGHSTSLFAAARPCMKNSEGCGPHGSSGGGDLHWAPVLGPAQCGGSSPIIPVEAYRNGDVGPLGVVLSNGEFQITVTDLEIPGRGFPFRLTRTYRSHRDVVESTMGYNWYLGYDEYLTRGTFNVCAGEYPAVEWRMADGLKDRFVDWGTGEGYKSFNGFFGKLRDRGASGYQIRYPDGTVKTFGSNRLVNGNSTWVLTRIEDRNGNAMTFQSYTSPAYKEGLIKTVTDTLGRAVTFDYDNNGRLTSVVDFYNRRLDYHYDADGNLDWAKAPEVTGTPTGNDFCEGCTPPRKQTSYTYLGGEGCTNASLKHNLFKIVDGKGQTFLRNTYFFYGGEPSCGMAAPNNITHDFVATQVYGNPTSGQSVSYMYAPLSAPPTPTANTPVFRTTITDRSGNIQVHDFNVQGNPLRVEYQTNRGIRTLAGVDEINYVETWTYVDPGDGTQPLLVSVHTESGGLNVDANGSLVPYAGGMTVQYNYDQANYDPFQKGNLLSMVRTPGPRGAPAGQEQNVTSYTYEPLFNQPLTVTDPRGHVTHFIYDYQEGTNDQLIATPPAPVDPAWWGGAGIAYWMSLTGNSNLGDLNGDPVYRRCGNLIRVSEGQPSGYDGTPSDEITTTYAYNNFGLPTIRRDAEFNETHFFYFPETRPDGLTPTSLPTPDSRSLGTTGNLTPSNTTDATGGGYLRQKVLDATPTMLPATRPAGTGRDGGQDPPAQNISLIFAYDPVGNVTSATDGRGIRTDYWVNTLNQIVQITQAAVSTAPNAPAFGYLEQFFYDANNNVTQHKTERRDDGATTPPSPRRWTTLATSYDTLDRKISETVTTDDASPITLTTTYAYDANGNLTKTVFPALNVVLRKYDERDLLYEEAVLKTCTGATCSTYNSAVDSVTRYDYDGSGNLIQLTDPEGHTAKTGYDGYNRKVVGFDPALQKATFSYDSGGDILEQTSFGSVGGATPTGPPPGGYREVSHQRFYYDELSRLRRTDTKFFKDDGTTQTLLPSGPKGGLPATPPDGLPPDGWVTSLLKYDRLGRVPRTTDNNGHFTETRYDGLGRKLKVFLNPVAPFSDTSGTGTDERNAVEYQYDKDNNLTRTIETERGLDRSGGGTARKLTTPQQYQTDFKYDSMNRVIETKLVGKVGSTPLNFTTAVVYDSRGNKIQATDPVGGRTKLTYDGLNRLLTTNSGYFWNGSSESTPLDNTANSDRLITTTYTYDVNSRMTSIKDDRNQTTTFLYDNLNRQTRITYPDASYKDLTYNRDSLATAWTHCQTANCSADKLIVTTQYDALHHAIQKDVDNSHATYFIGTKRQNFEYDGAGRMTRGVDDLDPADALGLLDSQVLLAYNSLGKVISEDQIDGRLVGGSPVYTTNSVTSIYNGVGFRTQLAYPGTGARTITFAPDEVNRLGTLTDSFTGATKYDYLGPNRVLNRIYPNTTKLTMLSGPSDNVGAGYDDARRVVDWANKGSATAPNVPPEFTYGYDAANNRLFERRVHQTSGSYWKGERYTYDAVYRVTNRTEGDLDANGVVQTSATTQDFTLDGLGNWAKHKKDTTLYTNTVNTLNQYSQFVGPQGTSNLTYDFAGNLTSEVVGSNTTSYTYDFSNRLVRYTSPGGTVTTYRYDALGRRISKNVGGTVTRFVYDGDRLVEERDGSNVGVASYVYGLGSNEVLTRRRWTTPSTYSDLFYHTNALGSVTTVTDTSGNVVERYQYDAYGKPTFLDASFGVLPGGSNVFNTVLFTGQYYDAESGNYYYRARYYHPYLGRFLQRDPLGESESLNLYAYVFGNPVNAIDPTGMKGQSDEESQQDSWQAVLNMDGGGKGSGGWDPLAGRRSDNRLQGNDMEWQRQLGISRYHNDRVIERQEKRLAALKKELDASAKDLNNITAMEDPKGVGVDILGFGQSAARERSGEDDKSQLDDHANEKSLQGQVTFTVSAKNMMVPGTLGEVSGDALKVVADAVKSVTDKLCGNMPVEINGFSQGGGPAVGLTNMLTGPDYGLSGSNFTVNGIDPYMADNWNTIDNPDVHVNLFTGTRWNAISILANWGAHLFGLGNRNIIRGGRNPRRVNQEFMHVGHTQMDTYFPGAMGTYDFLGY